MKYNSQTITLTTDSVGDMNLRGLNPNYFKHKEQKTKEKGEVLQILLGGYNQFGRHIDIEEYKKVQKKFDDIVLEMTELYKK